MKLDEFDYPLPDSLIATEPMTPRDHSRLLKVDRKTGTLSHHHFYDLPSLLNPTDLLVRNNARVISARLFGKTLTGSNFEIFLLKPQGTHRWECLARPGKKVKEGIQIVLTDQTQVEVTQGKNGEYLVEFPPMPDFFNWLDSVGTTPLPHYIKREVSALDRTRYQTIFAKAPGSIAAPTAGLHFTETLLETLKGKGIQTSELTLHVGYGTFAPIRVESIEDHTMHTELFEIPTETLQEIEKRKLRNERVIAVGTTSLRALESAKEFGSSGQTNIFIRPGYDFRVIDGLITNFHVPKSTLFILICALIGKDLAFKAYAEAVKEGYRFFSFGDAMLIV